MIPIKYKILICRIQEINKITKRRLKEVKFFKQRLLNNYVEDWTVVPISDSILDEDDDKKSYSHLVKDKLKEEKNDEGLYFIKFVQYVFPLNLFVQLSIHS